MKVGIVIAEESELKPILNKLGAPQLNADFDGFSVLLYHVCRNKLCQQTLYIVQSGVGEINAAAATQMLISRYNVEVVINIGTCGGLTADMPALSWGLVDRVVHYGFDTYAITQRPRGVYPGLPDEYIRADTEYLTYSIFTRRLVWKHLTCASGDKFLAEPQDKAEMVDMYGAEVCDMEAAGVLMTANRAEIPAIIVKVVSDSSGGGAKEYDQMNGKASELCAELLSEILLEV